MALVLIDISELRSTLQTLSEDSMNATRQLDDVYYQLLEKISGLRLTIHNLQELSALTGQLHAHFGEDTEELKTELQKQVDAFGKFGAQKAEIEAMESRLKESRNKADSLSVRLDAARQRVSRLEESEKEYQDSISCKYSRLLVLQN